MSSERTVVYFGPRGTSPPGLIRTFAEEQELLVHHVHDPEDVQALVNRSFPGCLILDASVEASSLLHLCDTLKSDAFTAIIPIVVLVSGTRPGLGADALQAGADEVVSDQITDREQRLRLELALRRAARDVSVHPSTRLPGTVQIERDLHDRIRAREVFGVCYADLDHFKEFNDRYGYTSGDRVIYVVSRILRDLVRNLAPGGFVGHIGGDDFIFNLSVDHLEDTCDEVIRLFDELIPYQYTKEDRKAGYFLGRDRRGSVHRIPLMTLSIGVVTNQQQPFTHTGQVAELAGEMKAYAKSLPGSVYVVDRRQGEHATPAGLRPHRHPGSRKAEASR